MKFSEAMDLLKSGSKVTRHTWRDLIYFQVVNEEVKTFKSRIDHYLYNEDIMLSDGWIVNGQKSAITFSEAIPLLMNGLSAKLADWHDNTFIYYDRESKDLLIHKMETMPFMPDFNSFFAEDWIELK